MLIDDFMPTFDVRHHHALEVFADEESTYAAVRQLDLARAPRVKLLFSLRGMPLLLRGKSRFAGRLTLDELERIGFVLLADDPPRELLFGIVGRFWQPTGAIRRVSANNFARFDEPGFAKATWNFCVEGVNPEQARLSTETRVELTDARARRRFSRYWWIVSPFSALIRRDALHLVKTDAEATVSKSVV